MIRLSLFARSEPDRLLERRELASGSLVVGRGDDADWPLDDPSCLLSRRHCRLGVADGAVTLTDLSGNGVFLDDDGERCERDKPLALRDGQVIRLGDYLIVLAVQPSEGAADAAAPAVRSDPVTRQYPASDQGALLEAFCAAAQLDVSALAGEDPAVIMQRLGGVYRQMVIGLAELMSERTAAKGAYLPDHTTVGHFGNNPFRWASPQRLALDLLRSDREGFMGGPESIKASFGDIKRHLAGVFAGMRAAVRSTLGALSPGAVESRLRGRSPLLPGYKAAAWSEYATVYDEVRREADQPDDLVSDDFRKGYAARLNELESRSDG